MKRIAALCGLIALVTPTPAWPQQDTVPVPADILAAYAGHSRARSGAPGPRYWQIWPEYDIVGRLDPQSAIVRGTGTLTFTNTSGKSLPEIVLRLDQNRFRSGRSRGVVTAGINIRHLEVNDRAIDLTSENIVGLTTTVVRVKLSKPLEHGQRLTIRSTWDYEVPLDEERMALRQGRWGREVFQIAQWYPRLAMLDDLRGWDLTEHDGSREFYNPFARFRVSLQVPAGWLVGGTGRLTNAAAVLGPVAMQRLEAAAQSDTTLIVVHADERGAAFLAPASDYQTWVFDADSVNDFAWGASADFSWVVSTRTSPTGAAIVHALATPRHHDALISASRRATEVIATLSARLMPYAWRSHTLLDGPEAGMEYPGLTMSNGDIINHEIAHQWFPMMVGSDETRFDFLDEGFAGFFASILGGGPVARMTSEPSTIEALLSPTDVRSPRFTIGYGRGRRMLHALAAQVGEDQLLRALASYARKWRFKHPTPWDFMASLESDLGEELDAFWLEWLFSSAAIERS